VGKRGSRRRVPVVKYTQNVSCLRKLIVSKKKMIALKIYRHRHI
jgi:hypothetical protein